LRHSLHRLLRRWCWQRLAPPHSLHWLLRRWCWQMPAPPHSLHSFLRRWCGQMLAPPHSLHLFLWRRCWQMPAPPHSLQLLLWRWCGQMSVPPHSLHRLLRRWCGQTLRGFFFAAPPAASASPRTRRLPAPLPPPVFSAGAEQSSPSPAASLTPCSSVRILPPLCGAVYCSKRYGLVVRPATRNRAFTTAFLHVIHGKVGRRAWDQGSLTG